MKNLNTPPQEAPENLYSKLSEPELYSQFCRNNWVNLNESERLLLLSEVVNRENVKYGVDYSVKLEFEDMQSNVAGYQQADCIFLNREMYVNDRAVEEYAGRTIEFKLDDSNWQALETVLHENRHVFQDKAVEGAAKCDEHSKNLFAANGFTVSEVDGKRASQYMLGENNYALYYLNPTELDAFKTSQERTQQIIASLSELGMNDASAEKYISALQEKGYQPMLEKFRAEFNNANVEKDVAQVLQNTYFNTNLPVNKATESAVKQEMIKSQEVIDNQNKAEAFTSHDPINESMATQEHTALMRETEASAPGIKDEFSLDNYSQTNCISETSEQSEAYTGGTQSAVQETGTDTGSSYGTGADAGCDIEM